MHLTSPLIFFLANHILENQQQNKPQVMNSSKTFVLILFLALTTNELLVESFTTVAQVQVIIINNLQDSTPLTVYCRSEGRNFGVQNIPFGLSFQWTVGAKETAPFFCDLSHGNLHGFFDIFDRDYVTGQCDEGQCVWRVKSDGLYFKRSNTYVLQFRWP
ncbi:S-protein homolog 5-like [Cornus florida]|uniref:S-protein homolog 5-like n=1 Tax=Cornus florida TaxID=4283 RepID=UPI00289980C4|nr:S-protein homolog 5-like [Cornus florida]